MHTAPQYLSAATCISPNASLSVLEGDSSLPTTAVNVVGCWKVRLCSTAMGLISAISRDLITGKGEEEDAGGFCVDAKVRDCESRNGRALDRGMLRVLRRVEYGEGMRAVVALVVARGHIMRV